MDSGHTCNEQSIPEIPYLEGLDQKKEKGRGAFGAVFEVMLNGLPCIAKGLHDIFMDNQVADTDRQAMRKKFFDECLLLNKLKHPNIVQFLGIHQRKEDVFLVMEYMHMALDICLKEYPDIPLPFKSSIIQDVSYGLLHLHSLNPPIIHRDLTASNVLLTEGMRAKIADLGMSKLFDIQWLQRQSGQTVQPGALAYMPPEALTQTPSYDLKLDIFSFGALMLYTATQEFPTVYEVRVNDINKDAMTNHTIQILKRKCWIDKMGKDHPFRSLVLQCLQDRPEARPTAKVLSENINSICCRYKKEWKNILELHSQLQISSKDNGKLRTSIIELQKSNAELERTRSETESIKNQLEKDCEQHMIKEEQLYIKLVNQTSEFRDKQKQLEDELYAWLHASEELKMQPCQKENNDDHPDAEPPSTTPTRQRLPMVTEPKCTSRPNSVIETPQHLHKQHLAALSGELESMFSKCHAQLKSNQHQSRSGLLQSVQQEMGLSVGNMPAEKQDSSQNQSGSISLSLQDSIISLPQNIHEQLLPPISGETLSTNHSRPQSKSPGGVAGIKLPLNIMDQGQKFNKCNDNHGTMPVPTLRPRASTHSGLKRFSATQQNRSQLEMGRSVENFVPAEEQDDKFCFLQQRPRDLSDPTPPPSSEDLGSNTALPNSDLNIKIPQHLCEQHLSPTSKEPSTTINLQPRNANSRPPPPVKPKPRHALQPTS